MERICRTAACLALFAALASPRVSGQAAATDFVQLTSCGEAVFPSLDASAHQIAFTAVCDLVPGQNPDGGAEVFIVDVNSGRVRQLTNAPAGTYAAGPRLNASGKKVAFGSTADLVPGENADGSAEIFIMNVDGSGLVQLTHTPNDPNEFTTFAPAIDYAGKQVYFTSTMDLLPGGNVDGSREIFGVAADGTGLRQLTASLDASTDPAVDASGDVYFICNGGCGAATGGPSHLMRIRSDGTGLVRLTSIGDNGDEVGVDAAGNRVVFSSTSDLVPGGNSDGNMEIFAYDVDSETITQVTATTGGGGCAVPVVSANGMTVAFSSDRDLVPGSNPALKREVFMARLRR